MYARKRSKGLETFETFMEALANQPAKKETFVIAGSVPVTDNGWKLLRAIQLEVELNKRKRELEHRLRN